MNLPDIVDRIGDIADLDDELQEVLPYVQTCAKAYRWIRKKRIVHFLRSLDSALSGTDEREREKFEKYVFSDPGQELLADYSDTVLLTSSRIAQSALALLFADVDNAKYSEAFKRMATTSLRGCSDQLVHLFVHLLELPFEQRNEAPYAVRFIDPADLDRFSVLHCLAATNEEAIIFTNDLIRRGMLMPDHAGGRLGGDEGDWSFVFGISNDSMTFLTLLKRAEAMLDNGSKQTPAGDSLKAAPEE